MGARAGYAGVPGWAAVAAMVCGVLALIVGPAVAHDHGKLPNRQRVEPSVTLSVDAAERGQLSLHLRMSNTELAEQAGYGVKVFVDTVQLYTNEGVVSAEHSFGLDLLKLGVGYHYILANVCDHHDHIGVAAVWIQVTKDLRVVCYPDAPPELVLLWRKGITDWPGKLVRGVSVTDPSSEDVYLNCCGEYAPWPMGASDKAFFRMLRR